MSAPGLKPAAPIAARTKSSACAGRGEVRAQSPPRRRPWCCGLRPSAPFFSAWKTSAPMRKASAKLGAPTGTIMNSWKSIGLSACAPPFDDVHHRHRQQRRSRAAEIAIERLVVVARGGLGGGERHAENGVGAEPLLVVGAVELAAGAGRARAGRSASKPVRALRISPLIASTALPHALAAVALAAVAKLVRLVRAGRGARRHRGAAEGAVRRAPRRPRRWGCRGCRESPGRRR